MTRARITFKEDGRNLCAVYIHCDGYISGVGYQLSELLGDYTIVNGLGMSHPTKIANGMGCLAAQYISMIKKGPGMVYLQHPEEDEYTRPAIDYHYYLSVNKDGQLWVEVYVFENEGPVYAGWLKELRDFEEE